MIRRLRNQSGVAGDEAGGEVSHVLLLATVSLANMVTPLNSTMLTVALPEIRAEFGTSHAEVAWLVSAYLIAMAVAQPIGGRLSDQIGHGRMLRLGLMAFALCSIAAATAPSFQILVIFRTSQAVVGASLIPTGLAMLRMSINPARLGAASGITQSLLGLSTALGPLIGAALLTVGAWRWLFLVNVPLVLAGLLCLSALRYPRGRPGARVGVDVKGSLSLAGLLVAITYLLGSGVGSGTSATGIGVAGVILFGGLFWRSQLSSDTPVGEWSLFRSRSFFASTVYVLGTYMVLYTLVVSVPFLLKEVEGHGSATTGLLLSSMTVAMAVTSLIAGRLSDRWGRRPLSMTGASLLVGACGLLIWGVSNGSALPVLAASLMLVGAGAGVGMNTATLAAVESAPREVAGTAAGTTSMMRYFGGVLGAGILGLILSQGTAAPDADVFRVLFAVLTATAVLTLFTSFSIHKFAAATRAASV